MKRQMVMVGFLQAQNCTNLPCSWRHPESRDDAHSADYYQEIARILEAGKFHMAFFDDRLAMPDRYGSDHAHTVEYGIRATKMDPLIVLMTMAAVTTRLGLASTCSTTYFEPFDVARRFATLDLMTDGRAAWNVVTSVNDGEAQNMGREEHLQHDLRYDKADEFMEVVREMHLASHVVRLAVIDRGDHVPGCASAQHVIHRLEPARHVEGLVVGGGRRGTDAKPAGAEAHREQGRDGVHLHHAHAVRHHLGRIAAIDVRHCQPVIEEGELELSFLQHLADLLVVGGGGEIRARVRMPPGTRQSRAVLRLQETHQDHLAHEAILSNPIAEPRLSVP